MTASAKKTQQGILRKLRTVSSRTYTIVGVFVFAAVGTILLVSSHAATPTAKFEAEAGTRSGNATAVTDSGASGGSAVKFSATATFQANCIVKPSVCGYPDETNTGVPAGIVLTSSGSITVTTAGTVIDKKDISGQVIIRANNVTIRNSRITSGDYYPIDNNNGNTGLLVEDTEIKGTNSNVTSLMSFANYTARRVNIYGGADGFKADSNVLIEDSYIHDLAVSAGSHNDGIQTTGGSNVTIRHTTCKLSTFVGANACIQIGDEWAPNSNWLVENNLLDGGGWTINAGATQSNTMRFLNNRFTRNASYGVGSPSGAVWTGNYYDDNGAVAN